MSTGHTSTFQEFKQFGGPLQFPSPTGNTYTPPPISYEMGIQLKLYQEQVNEVQRVVRDNLLAAREAEEAGEEPPAKKPVPEYEWSETDGPTPENMLGKDLLAQMRANDEPYQLIHVATHTVWVDFLYGRDVAEAYWNSGGDPKAISQILYGSGKDHKIPLMSTSTEGASTTKKPASTSGTNSRRKSSKKSTTTTKTTPESPAK